jgi:Mg-chelatase subunit ChlD
VRFALLIACLLTLIGTTEIRAADNATVTIAFTADTEGHVGPCRDCPMHAGRGGLDRRSTALARLRGENNGAVLTLDGGNALFGPDSVASRGKVMIDGYNLVGVDALNISWRDFRFGKKQTLDLLKDAKFAALSANLLDADTGQLLFKPYVLKQAGATKVAIIGLTQTPAGMDVLPHLKQQLAGIKIRDASEALGEWLPKAKAEADQVVLLYYGTPGSLAPIREKFAKDLAAICVGGARPEEIAQPTASDGGAIVASDQHGKDVAVFSSKQVRAVAITPDIGADPKVAAALASANPEPPLPATIATIAATAPSTAPSTAPAPIAKSQSPQKPAVEKPATIKRPGGRSSAAKAAAAAADPNAPRVVARPDRQPQGIAAVGLKAEDVNRAIDRGADFLWAYLKKQDLTANRKLGDEREHMLCCLALVHAGAHKRHADFDAALRDYLKRVNGQMINSSATYQAGLLCMLVEAYGDAEYLPKLEMAGRYLLETQGTEGSWGYGPNVEKTLATIKPRNANAAAAPDDKALSVSGGVPLDEPKDQPAPEAWHRVAPWNQGLDGDSSNTQYALLGLNSVQRSGIKLVEETWQRGLKANTARQVEDGGFGYSGLSHSYGSMTCAGICAVALTQHWLGEEHPEQDVSVERGLAWMDKNFAVDKHPKENDWHYYYLYSLERVGRILDTEFIGEHEWYPLGARWLVNAQRADGAWVGASTESDPRLATSFALLFLTRATPTLNPQEKRGGDGMLLTRSVAPSNRIYVILDASGSMLDEMGQKTKFDIARDALTALVSELPENSELALRVYGSKKRAIEVGADADTELLIPLSPLDRGKFLAALQPLRARGKTPLAQSLHDAAADLKGAAGEASPDNPTTVLLLTDGGEDTRPRQDPVAAAAELGKLKNVQVKIIGFDINREDWTQQLHAMTDAAGGRYWSATDAGSLMNQVREALIPAPEGFEVVDASGQRVATGKFGDKVKLHEGKYALHTSYGGQQFNQEFWINTDRTTSLSFNATKVRAGGGTAESGLRATTSPSPAGAPSAQPSANARFCSHCGAKLPANSKFCPSCGAKVE